MVLAVLAPDIGDDLLAPAILEVHVDVRHRHPVRVEETLEGELIEDRIHRRDPERVRHDGARRGAATGRLDPLFAGKPDEVRHDQEVAGVTHRQDDPELVVEASLEFRRDRPVATLQTALALRAEPTLDGLTLRDREVRDTQLSQRQRQVRHLGDAPAVTDGLELVREPRRHLGRGLDVELLTLEAHPVGGVEVVAGPHAEEDVVRLGLVLANVVQVVGHDERQSRLWGEAQQLFVEPALFRQAVVLELQEEAILAEDVAVFAGELAGQLPVVGFERLRDLAAKAGGQPDQPLAMSGEVVAIDARLVVVAVDVGVGDESAEVPVADEILGQQDQVEGLGVGLALLVGHRPAGDIRLHADDRLDALGPGRLVERDRTIQRAVVRDGHRIHALLRRRIDQLRDPAEAVEQAELGVHVEVGEVVRGEGGQWRSMVAG